MAARLLDVAFAGLLFGLSIFLWFVADGFRESPRFEQADADFWPKIIFATMALITGTLVVRGLIGLRTKSQSAEPAFNMTTEHWLSVTRVAVMGALILGFFFAFQYVGFILSTFAFLLLASFVIPYKNNVIRAVFAAGFTILLVLFFTKALQLPLPRGVGVFYDFNLLFY